MKKSKTQNPQLSWAWKKCNLVVFIFTCQQHLKVMFFPSLCFRHHWTLSRFLSDVLWENILFSFFLLHISILQPTQSQRKEITPKMRLANAECINVYGRCEINHWQTCVCVCVCSNQEHQSVSHRQQNRGSKLAWHSASVVNWFSVCEKTNTVMKTNCN